MMCRIKSLYMSIVNRHDDRILREAFLHRWWQGLVLAQRENKISVAMAVAMFFATTVAIIANSACDHSKWCLRRSQAPSAIVTGTIRDCRFRYLYDAVVIAY